MTFSLFSFRFVLITKNYFKVSTKVVLLSSKFRIDMRATCSSSKWQIEENPAELLMDDLLLQIIPKWQWHWKEKVDVTRELYGYTPNKVDFSRKRDEGDSIIAIYLNICLKSSAKSHSYLHAVVFILNIFTMS